MKKIIILILSILMALGGYHFALPKIKAINAEKIEVIVFAHDMFGGKVIKDDDLKIKLISRSDVKEEIVSKEMLLGKVTKSYVYEDDYALLKKTIDGVENFEDKAYLSLKVTTEQALAGELVEGDIVTIYTYDEFAEETLKSDSLKYVEVVRVKNRLTEDIEVVKERNIANDMGVAYKSDSIIPVYVTVKVNDIQAMELINSGQRGFFQFAYRGNVLQNKNLIDLQDAHFLPEENEEEGE